jgi:hypothetical protein
MSKIVVGRNRNPDIAPHRSDCGFKSTVFIDENELFIKLTRVSARGLLGKMIASTTPKTIAITAKPYQKELHLRPPLIIGPTANCPADPPAIPNICVAPINVAATDSDVFHPDAFVGLAHVTPPERDALARLLDAGLVDVDVARWGPRARRFTWWKPGFGYSRNLGMRIDMIATDAELASRIDTTWIDHVERSAERPSDHAGLIADFHTDHFSHEATSAGNSASRSRAT